MNENHVKSINYTTKLLTGMINATNNLNGAINNHRAGDTGETIRSVFLFVAY